MKDSVHEVTVLCACDDIEHCEAELYISDIRIMAAQFLEWCQEFRSQLKLMTNKGAS